MLLGSLIWVGTYAAPLLAIWALLPIRKLFGNGACLTAFFAVAILGLIILPDRELSLFYCAFGWWPAAKPYVDRIPGKAVRILVKLLIYLALIILMLYLIFSVLGIQRTEDIAVRIYFIPGIPIPFTVIDFIVIPIGAAIFFYCDYTMDKMADQITAKARKLMKLY